MASLGGRPAMLASCAATLGLAVIAVMALGGGQALAAPLSCGDKITTDTTLHKDLVNCPHNGIIIGADDITLDLNGHTIDGDGISSPTCECAVWSQGHDGVTVTNGSVREFDAGVELESASHNRLLGVSSSRNAFNGILLYRCTRCLVRNSSGTSDGVRGLWMLGGRHVRVLHSTFGRNGESGIELTGSHRFGVPNPTHNLIEGNLFSDNDRFGIVLVRADANQVRRNRSVRDGDVGIYVTPGNRNVIAGNHISHTRVLFEGEGNGIALDGGDHNVFARNSIRDTTGTAIVVGFGPTPGTVVRRNHIHAPGEDGVYVDDMATDTLLDGNYAFGARDDGLDVNNSTTTLTANHAVRNGDLGIEAIAGVTDGGSNHAAANGDPRQCTHVACH